MKIEEDYAVGSPTNQTAGVASADQPIKAVKQKNLFKRVSSIKKERDAEAKVPLNKQ